MEKTVEEQLKDLETRLKSAEGSIRMLHQGIVKWERSYYLLWNNFNAFVKYVMNLTTGAKKHRNSAETDLLRDWPKDENEFQQGLLGAGRKLWEEVQKVQREIQRTRKAVPAPKSTADKMQDAIKEMTGVDPEGPAGELPTEEGSN